MERLYAGSLEPHCEALAHHYRQSGRSEKASAYLYEAGEKAKRSDANEAAIAHFRQALAELKGLPDTPDRRRQELRAQIALGGPLIAVRGAGSQEVEQAYSRARALCAQVGTPRQLFPPLWGLWVSHFLRAAYPTARVLAEELVVLARRRPNTDLLPTAHRALGGTLFWLGELTAARDQFEAGAARYHLALHRPLTLLYGHDAGVFCLGYLARTLWVLGYPDAALRRSEEALALARAVSHPFSLALALSEAAILHQSRGEVPVTQALAEALIAVAEEHGFPFWRGGGSILRGWALSEQGEAMSGIAEIRAGISTWERTGAALERTYHLSLLAEAYRKAGHTETALSVLAEARAAVESLGERACEAELCRLQGESLLALSAANEAEAAACFRQAIALARRQEAHSWELRAAISLSHLLWRQDQHEEARKLLARSYGWFTEGLETRDLTEARALLHR
jgi:predicted ATPase